MTMRANWADEKGLQVNQCDAHLVPALATFAPALVIFDKGGTLVDFRAMWGEWAAELAQQLEANLGSTLATRWLEALKFDPLSGQIDPVGPLAVLPLANLSVLTVDVLVEAGLSHQDAGAAVAAVWHAPDPMTSAHPLTDLPALFSALHSRSVKIAIATMDERVSTEAQLACLGIKSCVDALVCVDDGVLGKPAPDMVWAVCQMTGVTPMQAVVVGDAIADLEMGRSAGAGLVIGVLSGISPIEMLAPRADLVIQSVAELIW
jgi:phosphoglycolate phosphatase